MMRTMKLLSLLAVIGIAGAEAAPQSPEAFLKDIYSHYRGDVQKKAGEGIMLDKPADWYRYFTDDLAKLIAADEAAAAKVHDEPTLEGDPFVDAQDWDITGIAIHIDSQTAKNAKATVRFSNFKKPEVVHILLVETPKGWRIDDIVYPGTEGTLRGLYKNK